MLSPWGIRRLLVTQDEIRMKASSTIQDILNEVVPDEHQWLTDIGPTIWDCEESPFGICAYNRHELDDNSQHRSNWKRECCIFCGEPEERK